MSLRHKELKDITEADLQGLVEHAVSEGREIEYKAQLPGNSDNDKREFLYDVTSFANCIGGDLVLGVSEDKGLPTEVSGIEIQDVDAAKLRLENLIRDGIQPRIVPGVTIQAVPLPSSNQVLIVRVLRSLAQPHVVILGRAFRFYSRNSAGKYPLDVGELRRAYLAGPEVTERIRSFQLERLALITANEAPVSLPGTGKIVVHLVPFGSLEPGVVYDVSALETQQYTNLKPIGTYSAGVRHNFDGILADTNFQDNLNPGYLQVFRNGAIEAVDSYLLRERDGQRTIHGIAYEERIIMAVARYLPLQQQLGVNPPIAVMLTFAGVKGYQMSVSAERFISAARFISWDTGVPIDRDLLLMPEVVIEDYGANVGRALKPIFDAVWNAAGWPGSLNYDQHGNWRRYTGRPE